MQLFLGKLKGWGLSLALAATLGVVGCGPSTGTITGSAVYKGGANGPQPLKGGYITFQAADGKTYQTEIQENGTYKIDKVPIGDATVVVTTEFLNTQKKGMGPPGGAPPLPKDAPNADNAAKDQARYVWIPLNSADPEKSGLKVTVKAGANTYDPDLK